MLNVVLTKSVQHQHMKSLRRILCWFSLFLVLSPATLFAQDVIMLEEGKGILLPRSEMVESVFISDSSIADATVSPTESVFLYGKSVGETSLVGAALDGSELYRYNVIVTHPLSEIRRSLGRRFPGQAISIESSRGSVLISGVVATNSIRTDIIRSLETSIPDAAIINRLAVTTSNLVRLRIRLLEINRRRAENFGINLSDFITNNSFNSADQDSLNSLVNLLISNNAATIVQETTLATSYGKEAEFHVGSEIPVPGIISDNADASAGNFSLDYRFIGTELKFTPIAASGSKLELEIESSVSVASPNSSTVNGNTFPNLSSRSFRSNVELEDQQSFIIMGHSRDENVAALRDQRGGLASRVANIFARDRLGQTSQELVVVVTPMLAKPRIESVGENLISRPSNLEYILSRKTGGKVPSLDRSLAGQAGFEY